MYRGKLWTMRQFSGVRRRPEETNPAATTTCWSRGQTGLSVAFDLPTLMGYDADHAMAEGEVGKCGANISSLEDMEILFRGIPAGGCHGLHDHQFARRASLWAMYLAVAEQQGADWSKLSGHAAERHPEGVHRAEGVYLSAEAVDASGHRHDRVRRAPYAAI
jgi:methylmalonyl-CoA mutase N-terminal domain/subunit